jgi:hypothetical protein
MMRAHAFMRTHLRAPGEGDAPADYSRRATNSRQRHKFAHGDKIRARRLTFLGFSFKIELLNTPGKAGGLFL